MIASTVLSWVASLDAVAAAAGIDLRTAEEIEAEEQEKHDDISESCRQDAEVEAQSEAAELA